MSKRLILILLAFFSLTNNISSQENKKYRFLKIEDYKKKYPNRNISFEKGKYQIFNNDTLILDNDPRYSHSISIDYEFKDSLFLDVYKDLVYKKHHLRKNEKKKYMKLWKQPIKIYFDASLDSFYMNKIKEKSLKLSNNIDSLNISFVDSKEKANYLIYQLDRKNSNKLSKEITNNNYINYYNKWYKNKIYNTQLEINLTKYEKVSKEIHLNYIYQFFYRSLGHFSVSRLLPCESMFSSCLRNNKKLLENDFELLKYHYSYGICKFTDLETFEKNHKKAREELKNGRTMKFLHFK